MDVPSLLRLAQQAEEAYRMPVYKRAGDASLLIMGVFPDFATTAGRYPGIGALRRRGSRLTTQEYEDVAAKAYRIAADHPSAVDTGLDVPIRQLAEYVLDVKRPLACMAEHHLRFKREQFFGVGEG
jgi:hypothetical protein